MTHLFRRQPIDALVVSSTCGVRHNGLRDAA